MLILWGPKPKTQSSQSLARAHTKKKIRIFLREIKTSLLCEIEKNRKSENREEKFREIKVFLG